MQDPMHMTYRRLFCGLAASPSRTDSDSCCMHLFTHLARKGNRMVISDCSTIHGAVPCVAAFAMPCALTPSPLQVTDQRLHLCDQPLKCTLRPMQAPLSNAPCQTLCQTTCQTTCQATCQRPSKAPELCCSSVLHCAAHALLAGPGPY